MSEDHFTPERLAAVLEGLRRQREAALIIDREWQRKRELKLKERTGPLLSTELFGSPFA